MSRARVLAAAAGYLLGTFPSADVAARIATRGAVDLREAGSGNPGGLNALQVLGQKWGAAVMVADIAKSAAAGFAGRAIAGDDGAYAAATASIAGHIWPVWSGFRGGKGVASSGGAILSTFPAFFPFQVASGVVTSGRSRDPALVVRFTAVVWIASAALWVRTGWSNAWGAEPDARLVAAAVVSSGMILSQFRG